MHHRDAHIQRLKRVVDFNFFALVVNFALIHFVNAEHALHQSGFTRAILAHQRVNRAGSELELRMIERFNARKLLDNLTHLKTIFRHERVPPFANKRGYMRTMRTHPFLFYLFKPYLVTFT